MTPRRVLFPYVGDTVGGSHVSSLELVRALPSKGYEPVVGVFHDDGALTNYLARLGLSYVRLPKIPFPRLRPAWRQWRKIQTLTRELPPVLSRYAIDIVHTQDLKMHLAWSVACRVAGVPHVWHQRTPSPSNATWNYARYAAARISVSHYCRNHLPDAMRSKTRIVYNPFTTAKIDGLVRGRLRGLAKFPEYTKIVGFLANFDERKRPDVFVSVAECLSRDPEMSDVCFAMIGDMRGDWETAIRAQIRAAGLQDRIALLGAHYPADDLLAGCDTLLVPARGEAFGRTLVEAMLLGVPVVASADGGHVEIVDGDKTGLLVEPDDVAGYARAVKTVLTDMPLTRERVTRARENALELFSLDAHLLKITEIYADVLDAEGDN